MNKTFAGLAAAAALGLGGLYWFTRSEPGLVDASVARPVSAAVNGSTPSAGEPVDPVAPVPPSASAAAPAPAAGVYSDLKNATFTLDGRLVTLKNGVSSAPAAPGSATTITTRIIDPEGHGDLNRDGREDVAFFVTEDRGGSGRFYYVVAGLSEAGGYRLTNAFPVGDRITPEYLAIPRDTAELHVNFVQRAQGEPMTTPPSEKAVLLLKVTRAGVLEGLMK